MQERVIDRPIEESRWIVAIAAAFVLAWASGFIVPRVFVPYAEPFTFVAWRNVGAALLLAAISGWVGARRWPRRPGELAGLLWAGACLQGFAVMGLYWAVYWGLPVSLAALIGGLQPVFTALFAVILLGEELQARQWGGIALGFAGLSLAVLPKVAPTEASLALVLSALLGVASMAYGSIYQKRFSQIGDAWSRTTWMFVGASIPAVVAAYLFEHAQTSWRPGLIAVYAWSVLVLAVGATMGLLLLIEKGQASRAASLLYLVPPTSALMAYVAFGETIGVFELLGFAVSAVGVVLVQTQQRKQ
jgi:drug/metabolite transporter (DMT)-like permease